MFLVSISAALMVISNNMLKKLHDSTSARRIPLKVWNFLETLHPAFTQLQVSCNYIYFLFMMAMEGLYTVHCRAFFCSVPQEHTSSASFTVTPSPFANVQVLTISNAGLREYLEIYPALMAILSSYAKTVTTDLSSLASRLSTPGISLRSASAYHPTF
uniref:Uncharacterized protein n=1 Tax=Megaselia scalaris TaxID=36166 RepID=T1GDB6_MEGSC